ncbi:unnamed protein product [Adineta steineri]|uniref:Uncharacterized protein n=1 Tax=Adineta steineri TaxID=433720 RepID=A0A816BZP5_9BILA|nr:unnamed protein product [Adineta steineri]CAF1616456.1 unnamed protein product [Adineta steineri]
MKNNSYLTDSSIAQVIHHSSRKLLTTNDRVRKLLAHSYSTEILLFSFDSRVQQHAVPSCISPSTIFSKIFHDHIDWQSIASEEHYNANEVFDNNNEEQPDPNVFSFRKRK